VWVVDTNVLVYAADQDSPYHERCREWLETQRRRPDAWYSTWAIFYEFLRVTTHPRVMRKPWKAARPWRLGPSTWPKATATPVPRRPRAGV